MAQKRWSVCQDVVEVSGPSVALDNYDCRFSFLLFSSHERKKLNPRTGLPRSVVNFSRLFLSSLPFCLSPKERTPQRKGGWRFRRDHPSPSPFRITTITSDKRAKKKKSQVLTACARNPRAKLPPIFASILMRVCAPRTAAAIRALSQSFSRVTPRSTNCCHQVVKIN